MSNIEEHIYQAKKGRVEAFLKIKKMYECERYFQNEKERCKRREEEVCVCMSEKVCVF